MVWKFPTKAPFINNNKNLKLMKNLLILVSFLLSSTLFVISCSDDLVIQPTDEIQERKYLKSGNSITLPLVNSDGILVFENEKHLDNIVDYLEERQESGLYEYGTEYDDNCMKEDKTLDLFEENLKFTSLRTHYLAIECNELEEGIKAEHLTECPIPDDVQATLLNKYSEIIIGDEIYLFKAFSLRYKTSLSNIDEIKKFRNGVEGDYGLLEIDGTSSPAGGPESGVCVLDYTLDVDRPSLTANITWSGSVSANHKVKYEWGDNTPAETLVTTTGASKQHQYSSSGNYLITITIFNETSGEECAESGTEAINLNQTCATLFNAQAGTDGLYTFEPKDYIFANGVTPVRWEWNFGDGNSEVVQGLDGTVSHIYSCESEYLVTLQVITSSSSCAPSWSKTVQVTNVLCVDRNYSMDYFHTEYDNGNKKIKHKTWLSNALWPSLSGEKNHRIKSRLKSYKIKSNGKEKKLKKKLKIVYGGNIYGSGSGNCFGDQPINLTGQKIKTRKTLKHVIDKNEIIGTKSTDPYTVEYYVDDALIHTKFTDDAGC